MDARLTTSDGSPWAAPPLLRRRRPTVGLTAVFALASLTVIAPPDAGGRADASVTATASIVPLAQHGAKLTALDELGQGEFGGAVAVSADGDTALIGGTGDNHLIGAAWVFTRSGGLWYQQSKLTPTDSVGQAHVGSVALSANGDTALVGGFLDDGVGAAWVFHRSGASWTQQAKLTANDESSVNMGGGFGGSVALSAAGDTALIGGEWDNNGVGAAWAFTRSGEVWAQQGPKMTPSDPTPSPEAGSAGFGTVALSSDGNTAAIGGSRDNDFEGAAWIFTRSSGTWTQAGPKLTANDEANNRASFGSSLSIAADGSSVLIGGPTDDSYAGAAWLFTRTGDQWAQVGPKIRPSGESSYRYFGADVAMSGDGTTAVIGAPFDNNYVGAAWSFTRSGASWVQQGDKLTPTDPAAQSQFGSVATSADGTTTMIGGNRDDNYVGAVWAFGPMLVGSAQVQPNVDFNPAGTAEAFRYTAAGTGPVRSISAYLDASSTATTVFVGLYANTTAGNPGALLASAAITSPRAGAWNTVAVSPLAVNAGTDYWLAVLAPKRSGTIRFRDAHDGVGGPSQTSAQTSLTALPASWKTGTWFANSPASVSATP